MRGMSGNILVAFAVSIAVFPLACNTETTPKPTSTLSLYSLEYRLLDAYPNFFWCDPDCYPIGSVGQEERNSIEQFPAIRANTAEFLAILERLALSDKRDYTVEEKLSIYREHKKLYFIIRMTSTSGGYVFSLGTGQGEGLCIEGSISLEGKINESKREMCFLTCPICLTKGTFIDTPAGPVPVEEVSTGATVWTLDEEGGRVEAQVIEATATPVPPDLEVARVTLADGRAVTASPGHPTADGRPLGNYQVGDPLDGTPVASVERVRYRGGFTYDLLPAGPTGAYWANRVPLKSTLVRGVHPRSLPHATSGF